MMAFREPPTWTPEAAQVLRDTLASPIIAAAVAHVASSRPRIDISTAEQASLTAAQVRGYELALQNLFALTEKAVSPVAREETAEMYPDLDDDSKWKEQQQPQ